jgi:hypothetical protein
VTGPQLAMRASEGCIEVRLPELRKPVGAPVHVPMRNTGLAGVTQPELRFCPVSVAPAVTVTGCDATASSS